MFDPTTIGWLVAAATLAPLATSYFKSDSANWSKQTKRLLAIGISIPLGVGVMATTGDGWSAIDVTDIDGIAAAATEVWVLGQLAYAFVLKGTWLEAKAAGTKAGVLPTRADDDEV